MTLTYPCHWNQVSCLSNICFIVVILYTPSDLGSSGKEYIKTFCIIELIQNVFKRGFVVYTVSLVQGS